MKFLALFSLTLALAAPRFYTQIKTPVPDLLKALLIEQGHEVDEHDHGNVLHVFSERPLESLKSDFPIDFDIVKTVAATPLASEKSLQTYWDANETYKQMKELEKNYKDYVKVYDLNERYKLKKTINKNSLWAMQISLTPGKVTSKKKIVIIGQHHAREVMTHHAVFDSAKSYLEAADYKDLETTELWFVPVVNPDGLNYVFTHNRWWRKNRRKNIDGSYGVDLNRNYPFGFGQCGSNSSVGSSETYRGMKAASEIETQVMDRFAAELTPQYLISYHSSGNEVLFPYVCHKNTVITDQDVYYSLRDRLAQHIGFGKRYASSSGEDFEHHFHRYGSLSFLLEIGKEFQPSFKTYQNTVWPNVKKVLPFLLKELKSSMLTVKVIDEEGIALKGATVLIKEQPLLQNEVRVTNARGVLKRKLNAQSNQYWIKVALSGYLGQKLPVKIDEGKNKEIVVELVKR